MNAHELYEAGRSKMDDCHFKEAITYFEQSAFSEPHFRTLQLLGTCYAEIGDLKRSIIYLASAASLNDQAQLAAQLASKLLEAGDCFLALRVADRALAKEPKNKLAMSVTQEAKTRISEQQ